MEKILLGTTNSGKLKEFTSALETLNLKLETPKTLHIDFDPEESGDSFEQIALQKAKSWAGKTQLPTLVDDSGICIDALDGKPGIHSKRFFSGSIEQKHQYVLKQLRDIRPEKRSAHFVCAMAFFDPIVRHPRVGSEARRHRGSSDKDQQPFQKVVTGACPGSIATYIAEYSGDGFDYDFIFIPKGYYKTFSELGIDIKQQLSHRHLALEQMLPILREWKQTRS